MCGEWPGWGASEVYGELVSRGTSTIEAAPVERSAAARGWDYARYALLLVTLGLVVAMVVTGDAPGTWSEPRSEHQDQVLAGWRVPLALNIAGVLTWFLAVLLLVAAPRTWRATPAAWCWALLLLPVSVPLFLLLSGPTPGLPVPRYPARRLTGGWAFLICLAVGAAMGRLA